MPPPRNFENRTLFHGDNLRFLRGMNSETIDLIATDPPFNKGRDFHATPDSLADGGKFQDRWSWANDVEQAWVDEIMDSEPGVRWAIDAARETYGEDMAAFLCFMGVRLLEMKRVLKPTGSIYLHCDDTAGAYLKALMDAIFGRDNFRNEITWERANGRSDTRRFARVSDRILYYTKGEARETWNGAWMPLNPDDEAVKKRYSQRDARGAYMTAPLHAVGLKGGGYDFEWDGIETTWRFSRERLDELDREGRIHRPAKAGGVPRRKVYLSESRGLAARDIITDIDMAPRSERTGYPTQKPITLYERLIEASSNPGDMVLDPFAGCATTPVAAERLGRQWVGMDLWDKAHKTVTERIQKEVRLENPDARLDYSVHLVKEPPERTDGGEVAAPFLQVTERYDIPADGSPRTRAGMLEHLLAQYGPRCQGCDREFDDPRYLQLDHNTPHKDGGINHISNRVLLCGPCNREKGARYTLTGLRERNAKMGYMAKGATR